MSRRTCFAIAAAVASLTGVVLAQSSSAPRNDLPQPYKTTPDWAGFRPA